MPEHNDRSMQDLKPTVWIGKQGSSETMIEEIVAQLKKRKIIKVKWLQSTDVDPDTIAAQAKARLVEVRGRTMVLAEKGRGAATPSGTSEKPLRKAKPAAKVTAKTRARSAAVQSPVGETGKPSVKSVAVKKTRQTGSMKPRNI
ncbi:MAG TPA: YhbY family RNA-binding protein [Methanoregula sp.]|nr:YhbY family RNA-binding protein [Methanoregula sp.]